MRLNGPTPVNAGQRNSNQAELQGLERSLMLADTSQLVRCPVGVNRGGPLADAEEHSYFPGGLAFQGPAQHFEDRSLPRCIDSGDPDRSTQADLPRTRQARSEQAALERPECRLMLVDASQLAGGVVGVDPRGARTDVEDHADFPRSLPLERPAQHLEFPRCQQGGSERYLRRQQNLRSRLVGVKSKQRERANQLRDLAFIARKRLIAVHPDEKVPTLRQMQGQGGTATIAVPRLVLPSRTLSESYVGGLIPDDRCPRNLAVAHDRTAGKVGPILKDLPVGRRSIVDADESTATIRLVDEERDRDRVESEVFAEANNLVHEIIPTAGVENCRELGPEQGLRRSLKSRGRIWGRVQADGSERSNASMRDRLNGTLAPLWPPREG